MQVQHAAQAQEGKTRDLFAALHALQQEARAQRFQFQECRYRGIEIGCDVKRRFHQFPSFVRHYLSGEQAQKNPPPVQRWVWLIYYLCNSD